MVNYGEYFEDEAPTNTHLRRRERKFHFHKLSQAMGNQRFQRNHPNHPSQPATKH